MNRTLYNALFYLALPIIFLRLLWRSFKQPDYRYRWRERLGLYEVRKGNKDCCIAFHAVSVGEVHAVVPLIEKIQNSFPKWRIVLTTSTPTGSSRVSDIFSNSIQHMYLPYDLPGAVQRFLNNIKPDIMVIMETELWPNLIHYCDQQSIKVLVANGRLSEKSLKGYLKGGSLVKKMLASIDVMAAQSVKDGERFIKLGLSKEQLQVTGSMKFDFGFDSTLIESAKRSKVLLNGRPVLVAGSTREQEEEKVLSAFKQILQVRPDVLLILIPRHPERFESVFTLVQQLGFRSVKRSDVVAEPMELGLSTQVLVGDTMGEMSFYYSLADFAFVGGSLVNTGCQNIIEPAALGVPVVTGPSLYNFQNVSRLLIDAGAMKVALNSAGLASVIVELLENTDLAQQMSKNAAAVAKSNRGATERLFVLIKGLLCVK